MGIDAWLLPGKAQQTSGARGFSAEKSTSPDEVLLKRLVKDHSIDAELMGSSGAKAFVAIAGQRALAHGFDQRNNIVNYLDLMVLLGCGFDVDPQLPWAGKALSGRSKPSMKELFDSAISHIGSIAGETGGVYLKALFRAQKCALGSLVHTSYKKADEINDVLWSIHPEKANRMKDQREPLFSLAQKLTQRHSSNGDGVRPLYLVLMFLLGSYFEFDPRYAWAAEILGDTRTDVPTRYAKLHAEALSQLDRGLGMLRRLGMLAKEGE